MEPECPWCWVNGTEADVLWLREWVGPTHEELQTALNGAPRWVRDLVHIMDDGLHETEFGDGCLPLIFGRPEFEKELGAIGRANPGHDVHVYICGGDKLVREVQNCCNVCHRVSKRRGYKQHFKVTYERFG